MRFTEFLNEQKNTLTKLKEHLATYFSSFPFEDITQESKTSLRFYMNDAFMQWLELFGEDELNQIFPKVFGINFSDNHKMMENGFVLKNINKLEDIKKEIEQGEQREKKKKQRASQTATKEKPFGNYLFGEFRDLPEEDTEREEEIFNLLYDFIGKEHGRGLNKEFVEAVKELKEYRGIYPFILNPRGKTFYRIVPVRNVDKLKKLKFKYNGIERIAGLQVADMGSIQYKAHSPIQSWASNKTKLVRNWKEQEMLFPVFIMYKWKVNSKEEFLFNSKFLNTISKGQVGIEESETIRVSNDPIKPEVFLHIDRNKIDEVLKSFKGRKPQWLLNYTNRLKALKR